MAENKLADLSTDFAVKLLKFTDRMKVHYSLVNQLERSATSIGANIHESKYARGTADFIAKMQIALKECCESEYWLELLNRTGYILNEQYKPLQNDCGAIRRMLIAPINAVIEKQS